MSNADAECGFGLWATLDRHPNPNSFRVHCTMYAILYALNANGISDS